MRLSLLVFLIFANFFSGKAQQESLRMLYPFLPMGINPAEAGSQGVLSMTGIYRKKPLIQTLGTLSSSQQYFSFDMPIKNESFGIGFLAFNTDQSYAAAGGISSNLGLAGILSKSFSWGRGYKISLGANLGVNQYPILGKNGSSELGTSYGWGLQFKKESLSLGFSAPSNSLSNLAWNLTSPLYARVNYSFNLSNNNLIKVGSVARLQNDIKTDFYTIFWWAERIGLGVWYQQTGSEFGKHALLGSLEVPLGKNFRLGYAYDFLGESSSSIPAGLSGSTSSFVSSESSGFHQIYIRYELDVGNGKLAAFRP